jgi:hypothetical protein
MFVSLVVCAVTNTAVFLPDPNLAPILDGLRQFRASIPRLKVVYAQVLDSPSTQHTAVYLVESSFSPDCLKYRLQMISDARGPVEAFPPDVRLTKSQMLKWWPRSRYGVRSPASPEHSSNFFRHDHYFQALGLCPTLAGVSATESLSLIDSLESQPYVLDQEQASVNEIACWRITLPGRDQVWLAPAMGFVPVKRIWERAPTKDQGGSIYEFELRDLHKIAPCVWLPLVVQTKRIDTHPGTNPASAEVITSQILVRDVAASFVENADLTFPPGSLIRSATDEKPVLYPGGEDLLDEVVDQIRDRIALHVSERQANDTIAPWLSPLTLFLAGVFLAVSLLRAYRHFTSPNTERL